MEFLALPFMVRALTAALLTGLIAPAIGTYIVQRRLSLLGDGLGHVAIAGVGLALATGTAPLPVAVTVCVVGAVIVELLRQYGKASGDVGLAILFYGGLATGVLLASTAGQGAGALAQFLFGSLVTVSQTDLWLIGGLGVLVVVPSLALVPQLFAVCADETYARVLGLRVRFYNLLIVILAAVTVTLSMRTVGLLLVSALMVVPVAAAQNVVSGFRRALLASMAIGVTSAVGGVIGSYAFNVVPGALIVIIAIVLFAASALASGWLDRRRQHLIEVEVTEREPVPHQETRPHEGHVHGPGCGHPPVLHGDHYDFIHNGHRHAAHEEHYDEH